MLAFRVIFSMRDNHCVAKGQQHASFPDGEIKIGLFTSSLSIDLILLLLGLITIILSMMFNLRYVAKNFLLF